MNKPYKPLQELQLCNTFFWWGESTKYYKMLGVIWMTNDFQTETMYNCIMIQNVIKQIGSTPFLRQIETQLDLILGNHVTQNLCCFLQWRAALRKVDTNHFKNKGSTDEECCVARSCSQHPGDKKHCRCQVGIDLKIINDLLEKHLTCWKWMNMVVSGFTNSGWTHFLWLAGSWCFDFWVDSFHTSFWLVVLSIFCFPSFLALKTANLWVFFVIVQA